MKVFTSTGFFQVEICLFIQSFLNFRHSQISPIALYLAVLPFIFHFSHPIIIFISHFFGLKYNVTKTGINLKECCSETLEGSPLLKVKFARNSSVSKLSLPSFSFSSSFGEWISCSPYLPQTHHVADNDLELFMFLLLLLQCWDQSICVTMPHLWVPQSEPRTSCT